MNASVDVLAYQETHIETCSVESPGYRFLCFDMVLAGKETVR